MQLWSFYCTSEYMLHSFWLLHVSCKYSCFLCENRVWEPHNRHMKPQNRHDTQVWSSTLRMDQIFSILVDVLPFNFLVTEYYNNLVLKYIWFRVHPPLLVLCLCHSISPKKRNRASLLDYINNSLFVLPFDWHCPVYCEFGSQWSIVIKTSAEYFQLFIKYSHIKAWHIITFTNFPFVGFCSR